MPWVGPLLLSWAGLLAWRELMASGQCCRETAVPRSSSSAKPSRAEGTACRNQEQRRGVREISKAVWFGGERRAQLEKNFHSL